MIKIAICDDENIITSQIDNIISSICNREGIPFDTDVFYSGQGLEKEMVLVSKWVGGPYESVLLDS